MGWGRVAPHPDRLSDADSSVGRVDYFSVPSGATPYVVDTDVGGDPDDALALAVAASLKSVHSVMTCDEVRDGGRASLARTLLRACGRPDIAVYEGAVARSHPDFLPFPSGICRTKPEVGSQSLREFSRAVADSQEVVWVGMGPMTNLATLADLSPNLLQRVHVVQMGGWLRETPRPEHNLRLDPGAASRVMGRCASFTLVPADITMSCRNRLDENHSLLGWLRDHRSKWASLVHGNFSWWFGTRYPSSFQHDTLALAIATGLPATIEPMRLRIDAEGLVRTSSRRPQVGVVLAVDWDLLWSWVIQRLGTLP